MKRVAMALLVSGLCVGCSARMLDFTVVSSKNANIQGRSFGKRTQGEDCVHLLLGLIPLTGRIQANMKEAVDRAIEAAGPGYDALIDGVIENTAWTIILYTQGCFVVEGTPIDTKEPAAAMGGPGEAPERITFQHSSR